MDTGEAKVTVHLQTGDGTIEASGHLTELASGDSQIGPPEGEFHFYARDPMTMRWYRGKIYGTVVVSGLT